jgi:hypothetical protein
VNPAAKLAELLVEGEKHDPRGFLAGLKRHPYRGVVRITVPSTGATSDVNLDWACDVCMIGNSDAPGVVVARPFPLPMPGVSEDQWEFMLEVITYSMNEGRDWQGYIETEVVPELDPQHAANHPNFSWEYVGGKRAFDQDAECAANAPSWQR